MLNDANNTYCDLQLVDGAKTEWATDHVDLGRSGRSLGSGTPLFVLIEADDIDRTAGTKYKAEFCSSDTISGGDLSGTITVHATFETDTATGNQKKSDSFDFRIPSGVGRYLQVRFTQANAAAEAKWSARNSQETFDRGDGVPNLVIPGRGSQIGGTV